LISCSIGFVPIYLFILIIDSIELGKEKEKEKDLTSKKLLELYQKQK